MIKKMYLVAIQNDSPVIDYAQVLPSSSGPQAKYHADRYIRQMDEDFQSEHRLYVIVCAEEVKPGELFDSKKMEVCFRLI